MAVRANARAGECGSCGQRVEVGAGFSYLDPDRGWSVSCDDPACRSLCDTREVPKKTSDPEPTQRRMARDSLEVFGLAGVAVMKQDPKLALEVCAKLSLLEGNYEIVMRRS